MRTLFKTRQEDAEASKASRLGRGAQGRVAAKLGLLRAADLFRDLSEQEMGAVDRITVMTSCERGRVIHAPGETREMLFLLKAGRVQLYRIAPSGKKLVTAEIEPGTLFGDMTFTGHRMLDSFAEAAEDSVLCVMSQHDVQELIHRYPMIAVRLVDALAQRVSELESRLEESSRRMPARVAAALLRALDRSADGRVFATHQELADTVGTYRETITRTLAELRQRGLIDMERKGIRILDAYGLRELVASDEGAEN